MKKTTDRLEVEKIRSFYNEEYYKQLPESTNFSVSWHYRYIAGKLGNLSGIRVLDIACGTGEWLGLLQQYGAIINGIDLSSRAIGVCKKRYGNNNFYTGQAENLPFKTGTIDLITCLGSMEHFVDPEQALTEMRRVAKPDAKYVILVPNSEFLPARLGLYKGTNQAKIKEDARTLEEWQKLFEDAGLRIQARYRDLHILDRKWIMKNGLAGVLPRIATSVMLPLWPLRWQYQVYFICST